MDMSIKDLLNYNIKKIIKFKFIDVIDKEIYKLYITYKKKMTFKKWKLEHKEEFKKYNHKYYIEDKEQRIKKSINYNTNNKDKINKHKKKYFQSKYITCDVCSSYYSSVNKSNHIKSVKHCYILLQKQLNI